MGHRPYLHHLLYGLAASSLVLGLLTDLAYYLSSDFIWVDMSDWLVTAGTVVGFAALIVGVVETILTPRGLRPSWLYGLASLVAWVVATLNMFVHTRDGLTSVVPLGLGLSALTCVLLVFVWWANATTRHHLYTLRAAA
jgi:uncharacterized membrane protein